MKHINDCYDKEFEKKLENVYVTDHTPRDRKFMTHGEEEDLAFFEYKKRLEAYNKDAKLEEIPLEAPKFKKGSLLAFLSQDIPGAVKLSDGSFFYKMDDEEVELDEDEL